LRSKVRSLPTVVFASCCVIVEPPWVMSRARRFATAARRDAHDVVALVLEEAAILGGDQRLPHVVGDVLERHLAPVDGLVEGGEDRPVGAEDDRALLELGQRVGVRDDDLEVDGARDAAHGTGGQALGQESEREQAGETADQQRAEPEEPTARAGEVAAEERRR
jgi:hypothetical protein